MFPGPFFRLGGGPVVNGDVVALGGHVPGHGIPHDAEADESGFCHDFGSILRGSDCE
jgi:hypothetical protein